MFRLIRRYVVIRSFNIMMIVFSSLLKVNLKLLNSMSALQAIQVESWLPLTFHQGLSVCF